ncbi:hypothetical protein EYB33_12370 [Lysinibacillus sphaericus]|uniref:hypothetical protein n=1 Tax=Lysinibacillus sphaericus TaxID=1421 RepID=UPI001E446D9D|nr:hypothetical protein [Lysinibacillus sphaericus]UDK97048.1 hypothetical protein EYB33_12370 [Lysinibacillus sphaericus]
MFTKYIDELDYLNSYSNYSEYSNDPNYEFEIFALNHSIQITGKIKLPPNPPKNIDTWVSYIEQRALTTCNKIVRSRYNDLIWSYKNI